MAGTGGINWGSCTREERGVSPIVGLVLLIGMVIAATTLLFLIGSPMLDAFESESEREKVYMCMDESDHRLNTVVGTGTEQSMAFDDPICQPEIDGEGAVIVTWYDSSIEDPDWDDESRTVSEELGTYEFELEDRTIAHQGGGIWELTDDNVRVDKSPNIGFDSEGTLQLNFIKFSSVDNDKYPSRAHNNHEAATNTAERLAEITDSPDGDDLAIKIESKYAEGWERHFEGEAEDVDEWNVSVNRPDENVVVVEVEGMGDVGATGHFLIDEDYGLTAHGGGGSVDSNLVEQGEQFHIDARITNYGYEESTVTATLSILDGSEVVEERTIESKDELNKYESIKTDDQGNWNWINGDGQHGFEPEDIGLTPGTKYEYDIETDPGGDSLDQQGTFYYLNDGVHYTVADTWTHASNGEVNVSADIRNLGSEDGSEENVSLEINPTDGDGVTTSTTVVALESGQSGTVTWSINESEWPNGDYEFDVKTDNDADSGEFEVNEGGAFVIDEDIGIPEEDQVDGTDGQVITGEDDVTIGAIITNTHLNEQTQNVTLHVLGEEGTTIDKAEKKVTIDGDDTEQVDLNVAPVAAGEVYEYNVSTENDDLDNRGSFLVVEEPSEFTIENIDVVNDTVKPRGLLEVDVAIENLDEADEQFVWLEGFDGSIVAVDEVALNSGEEKTITLEWGNVGIPESGDTSLTVGTGTDSATVDVDVEPLLEVNDVSVFEEPVGPGQSVDIEVELKALGGVAEQDVILEGADGSTITERVTVSDSDTQNITLEYDDAGSMTDRVTVRTDDDHMDEVVVVERSGPNCGTVSYEGDGTSFSPYQVSNIDELQCINEYDLDADYELVDDIDAQGTEYWNGGSGFAPIGPEGHNYPNTHWQSPWEIDHEPFSGTFDGNGHVITGLTIDRPDENFVGLFGATSYTQDFHPDSGHSVEPGEGSVIENIRLTNVSMVGNQHVGGLVGQAGGTVLNARSEGYVEGQEQLVGGLIGDGAHADLDNRLVATGTVVGGEIDPEWGANELNHEGVGGLVGRATWNTRVSVAYTQTDVSGDEYVGAIIGTSSYRDSEFEQMYTSGTASGDSSDAGAVVGTILSEGDEFKESIYWDQSAEPSAYGEAGNWYQDINIGSVQTDWNGRTTDEMTGLEVDQDDRMENLDYEDDGGPWVAIPDDYPRFAWELAAEGSFDVDIDDTENVTAGETAEVDVTVTSRYEDSDESDVTQTISLTDPEGQTVDTRSVTLPSTLGEDETEDVTLVWQTDGEYTGTGDVTVRSEDMQDSAPIEVAPAKHGTGSSDGPGIGPVPGSAVGDGQHDLGPGSSDSSEDDVSEINSDIDINVDVVEIN